VKRYLIFLFLLLIAAILTGCVTDIEDQVRVVRVIDGDTIEIEGGERVRYIGIDTPEVHPSVEYYGIEAWEKNQELVGGCLVTLERDISDRDHYGRLLRYVYIGGVFVNAELVRLGYARVESYPPDTKHHELLEQLEDEAKEAHRGLWRSGSSGLIITKGIGWKS
jgi:micrococcal nuclease